MLKSIISIVHLGMTGSEKNKSQKFPKHAQFLGWKSWEKKRKNEK